MELSWSTLVLEMINFLVLLWILKRFLYKPVLAVIERRRAGIESRLAEAETRHRDAQALEQQYRERLSEWDRERKQARESLTRELALERGRRLEELDSELAQEQERRQVAQARQQADALHRLEETALRQGAEFAARLLRVASGPETEARLVELLISELKALPPERVAAIRNHHGAAMAAAAVASAYPLPEQQRAALHGALEALAGRELALECSQDESLVAGARVVLGTWVLAANVRDELEGFASLE